MKPGRILLDTNVWLDYFLDRRNAASGIAALLDAIESHGSTIVTTTCILKDVFYLTGAHLKRLAQLEGTSADGAALRELSWECVRIIQQRTQVVEGDASICLRAMSLRAYHDDFEDNLIIAAAQQNDVALLVSSDRELLAHAPVACLTPEDALALITS